MRFDYSRLRGRIKMLFNTQEKFAAAMGISARTLSLKLNNAVDWTQQAIPVYFFITLTKFN